jgi:hypothetical protein
VQPRYKEVIVDKLDILVRKLLLIISFIILINIRNIIFIILYNIYITCFTTKRLTLLSGLLY